MVSYNEGSETRTLQTSIHGTIELIGCIDEKIKFRAEGYCESEVLGNDQIVKMTKITSTLLILGTLIQIRQKFDFASFCRIIEKLVKYLICLHFTV